MRVCDGRIGVGWFELVYPVCERLEAPGFVAHDVFVEEVSHDAVEAPDFRWCTHLLELTNNERICPRCAPAAGWSGTATLASGGPNARE